MSATLDRVRRLVGREEYLVSQHGAQELVGRDIDLDALVLSLPDASVVEDYPDAWKGPSVLVRQRVQNVRAVHVIWALERGKQGPAVLVTAYWPDVALWSADFLRRRP